VKIENISAEAWIYNIQKFAKSAGDDEFGTVSWLSVEASEEVYALVLAAERLCGFANDALPGTASLPHLLSTLRLDEKAQGTKGFCRMGALEKDAILAVEDGGVFKEQWAAFKVDFASLNNGDAADFLAALDTLFQRFAWCVPAVSGSEVSLYHKARFHAALTAALFRFNEGSGGSGQFDNSEEERFLFVSGDMSGIQKYIFDLRKPKANAKLLRARSFAVWALGECIARYIASRFGVPTGNIITSAGGKFLLLLPNFQDSGSLIQKLRLEIETYFVREFSGKLAFILSEGVPASGRDIQDASCLIDKIGYSVECAKQRKMQAFLAGNSAVLTEYYDELQKYGACPYCGILPASLPLEADDKICPHCRSLIELGGRLLSHKANTLVFNTEKLTNLDDMVKVSTKDSGRYLINEYQKGRANVWLPYCAPEKNGEILTFEEIARMSLGVQKLAMFKADVDNLGLVFSNALGDRISFSLYAQLSQMLHYFFSAYLYHYIQRQAEYREKIYTVFSGGDDLCVVGAWDAVLRFVADFRGELDRLTMSNPSVTLSGGIALANPGLPVRAMAEEAETALEEAKSRKDRGGKPAKNGVSLFGVTVGWDEYKKCLQDGQDILAKMQCGNLTTGVVYKMIDFANRAENIRGGSTNPADYLWASNFKYMITRNIKDEEVRRWFSGFGTTDNIEKSRIAVSYALYANRKNEEERENG
jgi:CRISPR-associated protein Csm1